MSEAKAKKTKLKRHNPAGFIVSVILFVALVGATVGGTIAGVVIGGNALETHYGVSAYDILACLDDITAAADGVVTNPYDSEDSRKFYTAMDSALFLKDGAVTDEYIEDLVYGGIGLSDEESDTDGTQAATSADDGDGTDGGSFSSDIAAEQLMSIFTRDNFDLDALAAYNTKTGGAGVTLTDRETAAFINSFLFESDRLDEIIDGVSDSAVTDFTGGKSVSELLSLEQMTVRKGSDLSDADRVAFAADDGGVYMALTVSVNLTDLIKSAIGAYADENLGAIAAAFLPAKAYLTASVDLTDASAGMKFGINRMASETCEMHYLTDEMRAKYGEGGITEFERLCIIVESFSGQDIMAYAEAYTAGVTGFLCEGGGNLYSFADAIDLNSVRVNADGAGEFTVDAYGIITGVLADALGSGELTENDVISVIQAMLCTDADDALVTSDRVDIYTSDLDELESLLPAAGMTSTADIDSDEDIAELTALGADIIVADPGQVVPENYVNVYSGLMADNLFDAFDIQDREKYTSDDIIAVIQAGGDPSGLTQTQLELYEEITMKAEGGTVPGEFTVEITDKMLGSALRDMTDTLAGSFGQYGLSVHSVSITESGDTDYAEITVSVDVASLVGNGSGYIGDLLPDAIAVGVRLDITPGREASARVPAEWTAFNGIGENGGTAPLEELTCSELISSIGRMIPGIDLEGVLSSFSSEVNDALSDMTELFGDFSFVPGN